MAWGEKRVNNLWIMWHRLHSQNGVWRIRINQMLMDLYGETDISEIRKGKLWWLRHAGRMPEERTVKIVFKNIPEGEKSVGKPRKRWLDDGEKQLGIDTPGNWSWRRPRSCMDRTASAAIERERERETDRQKETDRFHCQISLTLDLQDFEVLIS